MHQVATQFYIQNLAAVALQCPEPQYRRKAETLWELVACFDHLLLQPDRISTYWRDRIRKATNRAKDDFTIPPQIIGVLSSELAEPKEMRRGRPCIDRDRMMRVLLLFAYFRCLQSHGKKLPFPANMHDTPREAAAKAAMEACRQMDPDPGQPLWGARRIINEASKAGGKAAKAQIDAYFLRRTKKPTIVVSD